MHQKRAGKYYVLHNRALPVSSRPDQPHLQLCYMGRILASFSLTQRWPGSLTCRKGSLLLQSLKDSKSTWYIVFPNVPRKYFFKALKTFKVLELSMEDFLKDNISMYLKA